MSRIVIVIFLSATVATAATTKPSTRATSKATTQAAIDPLVDQAVAAAREDRLEAFAASLNPQLAEAIADPKTLDLPRITRFATFRTFGRYFGRAKAVTPGGRDTLAWLARQPALLPIVMMNV